MTGGRGAWKRYLPVVLLLAVAGVIGAGAVLVKQRLPLPFRDTYDVRAQLPAADGVAPGLGQAVNVAGVRVGSISDARIVRDVAEVTLRIDRGKLARVYRDARVDLRPITPLKDMEMDLQPGTRSAGPLPEDGVVPASRTSSPTELATLLSQLDADTRTFLAGLLRGVGDGLRGRSSDMRSILLALGPTANQVGEISRTVAARDRELTRLVSNVASVTKAASADGDLAAVVATANRTLAAVAGEDRALRGTLATLPAALGSADRALSTTRTLAGVLTPTLREAVPALRPFPGTLRDLTAFTDQFRTTLGRDLRPLVRDLRPIARRAAPAVTSLTAAMPDLSRILQVVTYAANEVAYNPPGKDEGMLYWIAWFIHNWNSTAGNGDAHGGNLRARLSLSCSSLTEIPDLAPLFRLLTGANSICPT